jgi:hypothetical protein
MNDIINPQIGNLNRKGEGEHAQHVVDGICHGLGRVGLHDR